MGNKFLYFSSLRVFASLRFNSLFLTLACLPFYVSASVGYIEPWGKNADLKVHSPSHPASSSSSSSPLAWGAEKLIWFHQNIISPVDGPRSHFRPSSSQYMLQAIRSHGFFKGFTLGCDRLLRENEATWVYRTIEFDGKLFKWDPPPSAPSR